MRRKRTHGKEFSKARNLIGKAFVPNPDGLPPDSAAAKNRGNPMMLTRRKEMATDPVCKMKVEPNQAAAQVDYVGQVYYFCSVTCHKKFIADPQKYTSGTAAPDHSCCGAHQ